MLCAVAFAARSVRNAIGLSSLSTQLCGTCQKLTRHLERIVSKHVCVVEFGAELTRVSKGIRYEEVTLVECKLAKKFAYCSHQSVQIRDMSIPPSLYLLAHELQHAFEHLTE